MNVTDGVRHITISGLIRKKFTQRDSRLSVSFE